MACCIPAVSKSYDYAKAAITLELSNSFPWPKIVSKFTISHLPRRGWGLGMRLSLCVLILLTWNTWSVAVK